MKSPIYTDMRTALQSVNQERARLRGFSGLGQGCDDGSTPVNGICDDGSFPMSLAVSSDPIPTPAIDSDPFETDASGNVCLASMMGDAGCPTGLPVDPAAAALQACAADPNCTMPPGQPHAIPYGTPGGQMMPGTTTATPAQLAALAKLAGAATPAALTAAQIATGLTQGTVSRVATTVCPSGYRSSTGACVQAASQWFSFATNTQVMTFGAFILAAIVIVPMLSGGGGGRRRR